MSIKIIIRRDTAEQWSQINPVLALGELAYDETNKELKVDDGQTPWNDLDKMDSSIKSFVYSTYISPVNGLSMEEVGNNRTIFRAGALYYLGTNGLTSSYYNVQRSGKLNVTLSSPNNNLKSLITNRTLESSLYISGSTRQITFDFGLFRKIALTNFVWQHGNLSTNRALNYKLVGSTNGITESEVAIEAVVSPPAPVAYSYKVDTFPLTKAYRYWLLIFNGLDSEGETFSYINDVEFFGLGSGIWS